MFRIQFFSCFLLPDIQAMFPLKPLSVTVCGNQYPRIGCKCGQGSFELLVRLILCLGVEGVAPKRGSFVLMADLYPGCINVDTAIDQVRYIGLPDLMRRSERDAEYVAVFL